MAQGELELSWRSDPTNMHNIAITFFDLLCIVMLLWLGLGVRVALLMLAEWQDRHHHVKYTDIDYEVYTDAASYMWSGQSPYQRSTYRYTPLLAAALTPNVALTKLWGKLLFCTADLVAARLYQMLLTRQGTTARLHAVGVALWLFSPFTVTISTRGSGESLVTVALLALLLLVEEGQLLAAALLFGLAVHWRLWPIIFALPIVRHLALRAQRHHARRPRPQQKVHTAWTIGQLWTGVVSWQGVAFGAVSGAVFLGLGALFYALYGWQFVHETYTYHATRTDPRHNFSPYYLPAYLSTAEVAHAARWNVGWAFTLAQVAVQLAAGWRCAGDLPFCMLLQSLLLVAFNKVCTAQYFVWWLSFLPLVLPQLAQAPNRARMLAAAAGWVAAMAHWLLWAYLLEFQGWRVHFPVWAAGVVFMAANVWLVLELLAAHDAAQASGTRETKKRI